MRQPINTENMEPAKGSATVFQIVIIQIHAETGYWYASLNFLWLPFVELNQA
jgi:hypothetical protein